MSSSKIELHCIQLLTPTCAGTWLARISAVHARAQRTSVSGSRRDPPRDAARVECPAHDLVRHTRQVLRIAAADEHDRVLLQIVALPRDVGDDDRAVAEPYARNLALRRVGLLRRAGRDFQADALHRLRKAGPSDDRP